MSKHLNLLFIFIFYSITSFSQEVFTISGSTRDIANGEDLIGVNIAVEGKPRLGAVSNTFGFYSLSLEEGEYTILYSYLGYKLEKVKINLTKDIVSNINLSQDSQTLSEVVVSAERSDANVVSTDMGVSKLTVRDIETVPVLFGEQDIMKTLQLMPGVKPASDGNAGFFVRGGAADQNLILLDGAPVYNASHLLGFFSVFNSSAIKDVKLYKGAMPSEYGGRLASVMDVKMKDGNSKDFAVDAGIGLISSKITLEGPIVKDKGSFIVSGRRTYADLFLKLSNDETQKNSRLYFYDLNLKANYRISDKDRVFASAYFGRDVLSYYNLFGFNWGNATATLRWNHIFNSKLFSNTSFIYSSYSYNINVSSDVEFNIASKINDWNFKQEFDYYLNDENTMKFGLNIIHHTFMPGEFDSQSNEINDFFIDNKYSLESAAYVGNDQKLGDYVTLAYGLRFTNFSQLGPGNIITWDKAGDPIAFKQYSKNEIVASYNRFAPRFAATLMLNDVSSLKTSYVRSYQFLHMISNSNTASPTDVWLPTSNNIKPASSDQVSLGYFRNFNDNLWEFSTETYFKYVGGLIDYRTGAQTTFNAEVESELIYGDGRAYGIEFMLKKSSGKLNGWVTYTLSRSEKLFTEINDYKWFSAKQDRIHDFSIVANYNFTDKITFSATWVYFTGNAVTFPSGKYEIDGQVVPYYTERNGYRMPDYHRLDVGLTIRNKPNKRFKSSWNFSIYNAYARENAYSISFSESEDVPGKTEAVQIALFKMVPSISYNFSF